MFLISVCKIVFLQFDQLVIFLTSCIQQLACMYIDVLNMPVLPKYNSTAQNIKNALKYIF